MTDLSGYWRHIDSCNPKVEEPFIPWTIEEAVVGWVRPWLAERLLAEEEWFVHRHNKLALHPKYTGVEARSAVLAKTATQLESEGLISSLMGEMYPVTPGAREEYLAVIDRSAGAYFGIRAFGQHLNAYVRRRDGLFMWVGRRAADRLVFPDHLDNMVAGGLPSDVGLHENLLKEAWEEAALPAKLAEKSRPVSVVTYNRVAKRGYRPDILYCYDLELSDEFKPQNTDGEVAQFMLLPVEEVARLVRETDEFKLNCNLVVTDFLLRHGYIKPQDQGYLDLALGLRQPLRAPNSIVL